MDPPFDPRANTDREIQHITEDRLGRAGFARQIATRIAAAGKGPSIVYGLAGPWGGGKTSVLNMVDDVLREEHGTTWSVVRFTPWSASDVDAITVEFYKAIAEAMPRTNSSGRRAKQMLLAAAPVAAAIGKAALKGIIESKIGEGVLSEAAEAGSDALADQVGDFKVDPDPFTKRFDRLSKLITKAGRQVLIIVDDMDRLHVDELLGVMKAVRLLGRFDNVHYLLSYDKSTVIDVLMASELTRDEPVRADRYLEKIVQYPFELPPVDPVHLANEFLAAMKAVLTVHGMISTEDPSGQERSIGDIFDSIPDKDQDEMTLRFIYRLASQVDILLTLVGDEGEIELAFNDAVLVTYTRLKHNSIYRELPRWRSELISHMPILGAQHRGATKTQQPWNVRIRALMEKLDDADVGDSHVEQVLRLLGQMFPRVIDRNLTSEQIGRFRIQDGEYFRRYFAFGLPVEDVADNRVRRELKALISTGDLPADSAIATIMSGDAGALGRIRRKVIRNLEILTSAPTKEAAKAAHSLCRALQPGDLDYGRWAVVVYAILGNAVCSAETAAAARVVIDQYNDEFGLLATAAVLAHPSDLAAVDHTKMVAASASIRDQIEAACELDLTTDVIKTDANALTVLHFAAYLDPEQWERLRAFAREQLHEGKSKLHHIAARFVRLRERKYENRPSRFDMDHHIGDYFAAMLPIQEWDKTTLPEYLPDDVALDDDSLTNRYKIAAVILHQILDEKEASGAAADE